jgi:hypothetical protein
LAQPGFFGLNVWFLRFRSPISIALGVMLFIQVQVLIFALIMWVFALMGVEPGNWPFAEPVAFCIVAFSAVLGLVLAWDAYRRWLVTDFD